MLALNKSQPNFCKFKWHAQLKETLAKVGEKGDIPETLGDEMIEAICRKYERKLSLTDAERILDGRFNPVYDFLMEQEGTQTYFSGLLTG